MLTRRHTMNSNNIEDPDFSFGILADVQYAEIPNRWNYTKTCMRYYRNAAVLAREAALAWNAERIKSSFVVHLGDLIDGSCNQKGKANSEKALRNILAALGQFDGPIHYVLGNHEFYNFTRKEIHISPLNTSQLESKSCEGEICKLEDTTNEVNQENCGCKKPLYYKFSPHQDFCFIVLDTYDVSGIGHLEECPRYAEAMKILCAVNKNEHGDLNNTVGLEGPQRRFVLYNGGIGDGQLLWLRNVLKEATQKQQMVFLLGHIPIHPAASCDKNLLWNYEEVLVTLHEFDCVAAMLCGHHHEYAYKQDAKGIHHVTFPGIIEVEPGSNGFATIDVYHDRCRLRGVGQMPSLELEYATVPKSKDRRQSFLNNDTERKRPKHGGL